ncbi:MAG: hypothetical protein HND39_06675 [Ignavibacteriota bacterium]|jgi:hypothetical protein|nr:MAG: hypothetical protein EDM72_13965 [Chlorobiota bacterium]MBE7475954.1 hypothetical protein [Ignavibacteriales bacterium]MBL1123238.1 hypothetical protein [Ignavibacteriota bacterium]MBV6420430.1 hypothetical protein [Ignavibacteriaceae bacterium]MCE7856809.1 hypothetical protein [Ignavibacteria bacterium CHB3]MEB2297146.1 hypothetical protein [Ignavibacteria bacterium]
MKNKLIVNTLLVFLISANLFSQEIKEDDPDYKPRNLQEAISQLDIIFPDSTKEQIITMSEDEFVIDTHFSTGLWIRNEWLYDRVLGYSIGDSDLREELLEMGVPSNDDMSGLILRSYYRHLTNQDLNIDQQIIEIQRFYIEREKIN